MTREPQALIAELTHRCPLHCVYCSNPTAMRPASVELSTAEWVSVIRQAADIGCLHLHFTGGEPLLRRDLQLLISAARNCGLYTNLITSGLGLTRQRLEALAKAGLDHLQLSFQDSDADSANMYAGAAVHFQKVRVAPWIREHNIAFTVNVVVHRQNIGRIPEIIQFAEELGADKLEIANVQYYGWALRNRARLLPTRAQVVSSLALVEEARNRLTGRMRIDYVLADYHAKYPKPCMGGWGRISMLIDPAGDAMPCHSARVIPGLEFPNVREHALQYIWYSSLAFQRFRGEEWMQEPCRSCQRRSIDFGGCRCQALLLTGDAATTDPVCSLSPRRGLVDTAVAEAVDGQFSSQWVYRIDPVQQSN